MNFIFLAIVSGILATLIMDAWTYLQRLFWKVPSLNYCLVGRWIMTMPEGKVKHTNIMHSTSKKRECLMGWVCHYLIGIAFACFYLLVSGFLSLDNEFLTVVGFGVLTVVFPFLVMQPSFGFGIAASKTPNPWLVRFRSSVAHLSFGVGLFASLWLVEAVVRMV